MWPRIQPLLPTIIYERLVQVTHATVSTFAQFVVELQPVEYGHCATGTVLAFPCDQIINHRNHFQSEYFWTAVAMSIVVGVVTIVYAAIQLRRRRRAGRDEQEALLTAAAAKLSSTYTWNSGD